MEEAKAGLYGFFQNSDAAFATIAQSTSALTDEEIDRLVDGKTTEKELLMDEEIERLARSAVSGKKQTPRNGGGGNASDLIVQPVNAPDGREL